MTKKSVNLIRRIMEDLCQEPRTVGTTQSKKTQKYIKAFLEENKYSVSLQEEIFRGWRLLDSEFSNPRAWYEEPIRAEMKNCLPVVWSGSTNGTVTGRIARSANRLAQRVKTFEHYKWFRYPVVNDENEIIAYILTNDNENNLVWPQPIDELSEEVKQLELPYVIVGTEEHDFIESCVKEGINVVVGIESHSEPIENASLTNIIAKKSKTPPKFIVTSHYDSFVNTVGANDNASGTTAVMSLARRIASGSLSEDLHFVFFDAEEWNKLGAYKFVEEMDLENHFSDLQLVINVDSVGFGDWFYIKSPPEYEKKVKSALAKGKYKFKKENDDKEEKKFSDDPPEINVIADEKIRQFDTWPFLKKRIPAIQIGTAGNKNFRYWHDPRDHLAVIGIEGYKLIDHAARIVRDLIKNWE